MKTMRQLNKSAKIDWRRFHAMTETQFDCEPGCVEPNQTKRAYLKAIAREPNRVSEPLKPPRQRDA